MESDSNGPIDFAARRREFLAKRAQERGETLPTEESPQSEFSSDVQLPDLSSPGGKSEEDIQLDGIIDRIDAITAYNKWIGKSRATGGKKDGNMISCPKPDHPDKNPSAWINTEDNTWFCGGCQEGGDVYDLAAIHFGYPRPGYKEGQLFHKLRRDMAESFGWRFKHVPGGEIIYQEETNAQLQAPQPDGTSGLKVAQPPVSPAPEASQSPDGTTEQDEADLSNVSQMWAEDDQQGELIVYPTINWRDVVPEDTFLFEYMTACSQDDSPEEYHFWHGLVALGHAVGRKVVLDDFRPVYSNLLICLMGNTGAGKSRSRYWLDQCIRETLPYHEDGTGTTGVKLIPTPASGEYLLSSFSYEGKDPANGKSSLGYQSVNGIVDVDEMSGLLARANRQGSVLKPTIMGLGDANNEVKTGSLGRGDIIAREPFCSIIAGTQPKAIRTLLSRTDTGSGFINRWVFAGGKPKQTEVLGGSHSSTVIDLSRAIEELKKIRGWGALERKLTMEPDAFEVYIKYYRDFVEPVKIKDETDLLKRIDLLSKKLMLLLAINKRKITVDVQVVEAVKQIMEYVIECFGILNDNIGITVMQDVINEIQRHILRHQTKTGRGASARDISKYTARKNYSLEQIKRALETMTALDLIELEPKVGNMGRPTVRYRVTREA